MAAGGGGGKAATRELFDTLLLWRPRVALDAKGEALVGRLAGLQTDRITRALSGIVPDGVETVRQFLRAMIDHDDPDKVLATILGSATAKDRA